MRIVVNAIAASTGGALTILESFGRHVREFGGDHEWVFLLGSDLLEQSDNIRTVVLPSVKRSWLRRLAFDFVTGRRLIASLRPDVVFSLQNTYTYGIECPQVVYVHQPLPFQKARNFSLWRRDERLLAIYQHVIGAVIKQSARHADHVIVQTQWMRDAIVDQVGIVADRVSSVLPALENLGAQEHQGPRDAGAFFYPTAHNIYKNNDCIYEACRLLHQQGMDDFTVTMTVDGPVPEPKVDSIGRVSRARVVETLSRSTLIFPSYIETYGLPLAEARALGSIILAADLPYAREVLDGYPNAHFFNPFVPGELAALMKQVILGHVTPATSQAEDQRPQDTGWGIVSDILFTQHKMTTTAWETKLGRRR